MNEVDAALHEGQLTVWDELVAQAVERPAAMQRYLAGFLSHIALLDDPGLVRVGRAVRAEAERKRANANAPAVVAWSAMLGALTDEWLRRHPRPAAVPGEQH